MTQKRKNLVKALLAILGISLVTAVVVTGAAWLLGLNALDGSMLGSHLGSLTGVITGFWALEKWGGQ